MMSTLTIHCRWEDETARERTRHPPSYRRLRIILSYLHFFSKSSLELICSRIFWIFLQFQWLRDTTSRFKDIQQNILSDVLFSETFYRISTQHSLCSSVCCCMSRESSSLIGRAGDTTVGL